MRLTRGISITLVVILFLGIAGGILWLLDFLAVINLSKTLGKIPVVSKFVYQSDNQAERIKKPLIIEKTAAEKENEKLKQENNELVTANQKLIAENKKLASEIEQVKREKSSLTKQMEVLKKEKQNLIAERDALNMTLDSMQESQTTDETQELGYQKLGKIYAEMKPKDAVKIMENLSDEVVIGILLQLEDDQVAKILSEMNPEKAAVLVDSMKN